MLRITGPFPQFPKFILIVNLKASSLQKVTSMFFFENIANNKLFLIMLKIEKSDD